MVSFVDEPIGLWPVAAMCDAIELSEPSYYAAMARPASGRSMRDAALRVEIRRVWENNYRCYGARRIYKQLRREGHAVTRRTVARDDGGHGHPRVRRGEKRFTTTPDAGAVRLPDLVDRRFVATRPNELWPADITNHLRRPQVPFWWRKRCRCGPVTTTKAERRPPHPPPGQKAAARATRTNMSLWPSTAWVASSAFAPSLPGPTATRSCWPRRTAWVVWWRSASKAPAPTAAA